MDINCEQRGCSKENGISNSKKAAEFSESEEGQLRDSVYLESKKDRMKQWVNYLTILCK